MSVSPSRSIIATRQPFSTSSLVVASPMPRAEPVTRATFSVKIGSSKAAPTRVRLPPIQFAFASSLPLLESAQLSNSSRCQQIFNIGHAQGKMNARPNRVSDDFTTTTEPIQARQIGQGAFPIPITRLDPTNNLVTPGLRYMEEF